jgi:hypothetical protein
MAITAMTDLNTRDRRNNFFNFACNKLEPNNHVFYFCVSQFDAAPDLRKASFIYDNFLKDAVAPITGSGIGTNLQAAYSLLRAVNISDESDKGLVASVHTLGRDVASMGFVATGWRKLLDVRRPRAGFFAWPQKSIVGVMKKDWFPWFDATKDYQAGANFRNSIHTARQVLGEVGFNPDAMGVY